MRYLDKDGTQVNIYQPNERRGGLIWGLRQASEDIAASRHVIARLFWRDFIAQFRQKILGYFLALLSPLFGIFSFLFYFLLEFCAQGRERSSIRFTCWVAARSGVIFPALWVRLVGTTVSGRAGLMTSTWKLRCLTKISL